jgi:hypothetical protein
MLVFDKISSLVTQNYWSDPQHALIDLKLTQLDRARREVLDLSKIDKIEW